MTNRLIKVPIFPWAVPRRVAMVSTFNFIVAPENRPRRLGGFFGCSISHDPQYRQCGEMF